MSDNNQNMGIIENINTCANQDNKKFDKKAKKTGTLVSAFIEQKAYDALLQHCEATGQSKTKAIERAILKYCQGDNNNNKSDKMNSKV